MLILHDLVAWHWALGGAALALISAGLMAFGGRALGVSTGFESLCALGSRLPYFKRGELKGPGRWRLPFVAGLILGGALSAWLGGGWRPFWDLGIFDATIQWGPAGKLAWMFAGGLLIGFGTRLAGGCTSGHGLYGLANLEAASLVTTLSYMAAGVVTTHVIYRWCATLVCGG